MSVQPYLDGKLFNLSGVLQKEFSHYPIDWPTAPFNASSKFPNPTVSEMNQMAWDALAKTNPSAPHVSVPTFLAELKDLPGMLKYLRGVPKDLRALYKSFTLVPLALKSWGQRVLYSIAQGHLTWRWGIKPMLSDLHKMINFCDAVERKYRQLDQLQQKRSIHTRVGMGSESLEDAPVNTIIHSDLDVWKATRITRYTSKKWISVQWNTTGLSQIPFDGESKLNLARRLAFGITGYEALATLWEVLPWSWFVDWFARIGTVIQANNNTLNLTHSKSCLMRTTTSETTFTLSQAGTWSTISSMPYAHQTRLQRWPIAPTLPFAPTTVPLVDPKKWSILASLYVLNPRRRTRLGL
jgi:hypothetical protein